MILFYSIIFGILTSASQPAETLPALPFIDEAGSDKSFYTARESLLYALEENDTSYVLSVFAHDVKLDFGGGYGVEELHRRLKGDNWSENLWSVLHTTLSLGGTFSGRDYFLAPYVYSTWPSEYDAYNKLAITAKNVPVYEQPDTSQHIVTTLSYNIVGYDYRWHDRDWVRLKLPGNRIGYVKRAMTRSPIDYRIFFQKIDGEWNITIFLAGD